MLRLPGLVMLAVCAAPDAIGQAAERSPDSVPADLSATDWSGIQEAYLKASNTGGYDYFGQAVAISGDTVVVGANGEDSHATSVNGDQSDNNASEAGAAYVFVRNGAGWIQQAYLKASNTQEGDGFGAAVSISGDTIVVGASSEDGAATGVNGDGSIDGANLSGAAYVFVRNGTTWSQQAYLKASNTGKSDRFGGGVSVAGDTVVVGASAEDSNATGVNGDQANDSEQYAGAAYVFVRSGTTWTQQAYLKASNTGEFDAFGFRVSISGDTIVVGSPIESSAATGVDGNQSDNSAESAGAAYVFVRSGTTWSQQAYLKASNTGAGDDFGEAVSLSGDTLVVGAGAEDSFGTGVNGPQHNNHAGDSGAAYVFVRSGTTWTQQAYLKASNTQGFDSFGRSVSVSGEVIVVGARHEDSIATGVNGDQADNSAGFAGAAYVFVRNGTSWSQLAYLKASNTDPADEFGSAVAVSGDTLAVGALHEKGGAIGVNGDESDNGAFRAGAAYVVDLGLDAWTDLGAGLAGSSGVPLLTGTGPLSASSSNALALTGANPSSAATLVFGLSQLDAPFKGGTLVPSPMLLVTLATNPSGSLTLPFTWPAGIPADITLYVQFWIGDSGAVGGLAASNGLKGVSS